MMDNDIALLTQKINKLNQLRRARAVDGSGSHFRMIYNLLPSLLHFNHPQLPGFREGVLHGIYGYPTDKMRYLLHFQLDLSTLSHPHSIQIAGLYSIGSTGSIGHSKSSDLDVWVCVEKYVDQLQCNQLQKKCNEIERWAMSFGVELNLFVLYENRFREFHHTQVSGEDCGSTQHMLLLEEFYRTATCITGKPLLWYVVPETNNQGSGQNEYERHVEYLSQTGQINLDEWVDFGPLTTLSPEEYFGASLWQLYKSIHSPYKSVLKTLLLESYTDSYPNTLLLASEMKRDLMASDDIQNCRFDHYYMMLKRVSDYLIKINDHERLRLARYCFYFKVRERIEQESETCSWCHFVLEKLIKEWGWDKQTLEQVDKHYTEWTIVDIKLHHESLLNVMMRSYRHLVRFGQRNNLNTRINPRDIAVLTRKLYAIYENLPAKVTLFNEQLVTYIQEDSLTFINVSTENINRPGWYLYNCEPEIDAIIGRQPVEYHPDLIKLIMWGYCNYLLSDQTKLFVMKQGEQSQYKTRLQHLLHDLMQYFPRRGHYANEVELENVSEIRQLILILNFENFASDYESEHRKISSFENVFNHQEDDNAVNLVNSIEIIYRNSWNEVKTYHFGGTTAILDALKLILGTMHRSSSAPELFKVLCYQHKGDKIAQPVYQFFHECITLRLASNQQNLSKFKSIQIAGTNWGIFFERLGVNFCEFDDSVADAISSNKLQRMKQMDQYSNHELPDIVGRAASKGVMQFFFEEIQGKNNLYVLNENNRVEIYRDCLNRDDIVKNINQYYAFSIERSAGNTESSGNFNFPHFYQLMTLNNMKQVVPLYLVKPRQTAEKKVVN